MSSGGPTELDSQCAPAVLELAGVSKGFLSARGQAIPAVREVSLNIPDNPAGDFVVLLGPSGCGKSTLLSMIAGLLTADSGSIKLFGRPVAYPEPEAVTVQQAYTCFPWLSALGNVEFGLRLRGLGAKERREIATEYLTRVGLGDRLHDFPKQLSGGMQQRVAIARTLAVRPKLILMDEPFGALDAQTRTEMQEMLTNLWLEEKNVIVFITHDITEALLLANRIIVLSSRPAHIVHDLRVSIARPRASSLVYEPSFVKLSQELLGMLKQAPHGGQVRVTL